MDFEKRTYDLRGRQRSIFRLARFDLEALVHMVFYRLLIFVSIIAGLAILLSLIFPPSAFSASLVKALVLLVWVLIAPQLYKSAEAFAIMASRGLASRHLDRSFVNASGTDKPAYRFYRALPYAVLLFWSAGFVITAMMWFP
ncbi:MAG: hypothetical protein M1354_01555 [Candidatus Marsarchaeota archaeon]|jgi:hypothetical protein|nr:hypothetical protein [Candidatus Marsarchaeota archaeon]